MRKNSKQAKLIEMLRSGPKTFEELVEATGLSRGSVHNYIKYYLHDKLNMPVKIDDSTGQARYFLES